jgi:hypothetical protein
VGVLELIDEFEVEGHAETRCHSPGVICLVPLPQVHRQVDMGRGEC